jgi:transcriptional regulator with XRE-family HTH domain
MRPRAISHPANNLRAWRKHRGLTQREVAEAVGETVPEISLLERGVRRLSHAWLRHVAPLLETTPGAILDFMPDEIDADIVRAAMKVPLERQSDAVALLKWLGRESVHLTTFDTSDRRARRPKAEIKLRRTTPTCASYRRSPSTPLEA